MGRRGRKRRLGLEDEYWQLILAGVGTVEACKLVGVGRKTGYRWRAERGGLPPLRRVEREHSGRYLSLLERQRIATLRRHGLSIREVARELGRAPSTISRELRRNTSRHDTGGYDGDLAHSRARERVERPRGGRLAADPELREAVQRKLKLEWSPEQIAAWLRAEYPSRARWHVCHETIYQALYNGAKGGLSRATHQEAADRTAAAEAATTSARAHAPLHRASTVDRSPARRSGRAEPSRRLGRRPHHRSRRPVRDRHPGLPAKPLHQAHPPARSAYRRGPHHRATRNPRRPARVGAPHPHLGPGLGDGRP